jgi:uncharacterized protein (DUF302 family)
MNYYFNKTIKGNFDDIVLKTTEELNKEGFGVLTDIDVSATLKKKLNVDFKKYRILGACNPPFAFKALQAEDKIGTMLPCNVIVQEIADDEIEVAAIDPVASMKAIENPNLKGIADQIQEKLMKVINNI